MKTHNNWFGRWLVLGKFYLLFKLLRFGIVFYSIRRATRRRTENFFSFTLAIQRDPASFRPKTVFAGWIGIGKREAGFKVSLDKTDVNLELMKANEAKRKKRK